MINSNDLYRAIGEIDNNLIEEAFIMNKKNSNNNHIRKSYIAAACLIIAIFTILSLQNKNNTLNTIYFNNIQYISTKFKQPQNNELSYKKIISFEKASKYLNTEIFYKLPIFNYNLLDNNYIIYYDINNNIKYDLMKFVYTNKLNTKKYINIYTSKLGIYYDFNIIGLDKSCTINNTNIYLGKCKTNTQYNKNEILHCAKFTKNNISFTVITNNLEEKDFLNIIDYLTNELR